jgi:hypothetical protein
MVLASIWMTTDVSTSMQSMIACRGPRRHSSLL